MKKRSSRRGQGMTEYVILVGVLAIGVVAGVKKLSAALDSSLGAAGDRLASLIEGSGSGSEFGSNLSADEQRTWNELMGIPNAPLRSRNQDAIEAKIRETMEAQLAIEREHQARLQAAEDRDRAAGTYPYSADDPRFRR